MKVPANFSADRLILDYLSRVTVAGLHYLPKGKRIAFVGSTRSRIERECGPVGLTDPARVREVLASLGEPEDLVRAERARLDAERIQRQASGQGDRRRCPRRGHGTPATSPDQLAVETGHPGPAPGSAARRHRAPGPAGRPPGRVAGRQAQGPPGRAARGAARQAGRPARTAAAAADRCCRRSGTGRSAPPAPGGATARAPGGTGTQAPPPAPGGAGAEAPGGEPQAPPAAPGAGAPGGAGTLAPPPAPGAGAPARREPRHQGRGTQAPG